MRVLKWTDWMCRSRSEQNNRKQIAVLTLQVARLASVGALSEHFSQLVVHLEHLLIIPHLFVRLVVTARLGILVDVDSSSGKRLLHSPPELRVNLQVGLVLFVIALRLVALALVVVLIVLPGVIRLVLSLDLGTILILILLDSFRSGLLQLLESAMTRHGRQD